MNTDDVLHCAFLAGLIFATDGHEVDLSEITKTMQSTYGTSFCTCLPATNIGETALSGPHLLRDGTLYSAIRLHDDVNGAFMLAAVPHDRTGWIYSAHL